MSSPAREPLSGIIRQGRKIIGGICLPERNVVDFIAQFNRCYGALKLKIDLPLGADLTPLARPLLPVGAGLLRPVGAQSTDGGDEPPIQSAP